MHDTLLLNSQTPVSSSTTFSSKTNKFQHAPDTDRPFFTKKLDIPSRCFFLSLPGESLTHITTYVDDPPSLFALSRVNRRLRDHVADDNTWYRVFAFHFLGIGPESDPQEEQKLLLRRTESTWKKEFVQRFKAICRWEKSRSTTLRYQPHYWNVSGMHLLENVSLMTSNLQYGIVTRSFPLTGKILKGHLDASGTTNGLGIGNPNEEFSPNVSCVSLSSCGGTGRIVWGFRNGEVAVTCAPRVMDSNRPAARFTRCHVDDGHTGDVRCVLFTGRDDELIVSGCSHGQVKLWDARRMRCLWTGFGPKGNALYPDACVKIGYCAAANVLAAAFHGGDIMVWWGFQLQDDGTGSQIAIGIARAFTVAQAVQSTTMGVKPPESLYIDPDSSLSKVKLLVYHANERHILRLVVDLHSGLVTLTRFCDGPIGLLISVKPCFVARDHDSALTPAPSAPVSLLSPSSSINHAIDSIVSRESTSVLAGDSLGRVCLWNWDAEGSSVNVNQPEDHSTTDRVMTEVTSSRRWEAHDDGAICAIEVNNLVIITGSSRGTLKVWDCLTFAPLRSFASPATKPNLGGQWDPVGQIIVRGDLLVANVGSRILVWQAGSVAADKKGKTKQAGKPKGRGASSTLNKWQQQIELNSDIRESKRLLDDERAHTQRVYSRARAQRATLDQLGLSETEAVEYVMMLSREEEEQRGSSMLDKVPSLPASVKDTAAAVPSDDANGVFILDDFAEFSRPQPLVQAQDSRTLHSPSSTSSSRHDELSHYVTSSMPSLSDSKGQLSSLLSPESAEPGLSSSPFHSSAAGSRDASPICMSARSTSGTSLSTATTCSSLDDPEAFPAMRSSFGSSSRSTTSLHLGGSWSRGSISSSQGGSIPGHTMNTSPQTSSISRSPLLVQTAPRRAEEEDDELKFVLELSLAEAKSCGEL